MSVGPTAEPAPDEIAALRAALEAERSARLEAEARASGAEVKRARVATRAGLSRGPRALPVNLARELALLGEPFDAHPA